MEHFCQFFPLQTSFSVCRCVYVCVCVYAFFLSSGIFPLEHFHMENSSHVAAEQMYFCVLVWPYSFMSACTICIATQYLYPFACVFLSPFTIISFFSPSFLQDSEMMFQPESDQMSPVEPKVRKYTHQQLKGVIVPNQNEYRTQVCVCCFLWPHDLSTLTDAYSLHHWIWSTQGRGWRSRQLRLI